MLNKQMIVQTLLKERSFTPMVVKAKAFAPSNIALCKYWGKRDETLNLPITGSLSISLGNLGATTTVVPINEASDCIIFNGKVMDKSMPFVQKISNFLDLFRMDQNQNMHYQVETSLNIPMGAGVASSACGFAALVSALDSLYDWQLKPFELSILARLGSGSAARSFWHGFVEWECGIALDGMDSYAKPFPHDWKALRLGLLLIDSNEKSISSRVAMQRTLATSPFFDAWPKTQHEDMILLKKSIEDKDFITFAQTAETNALTLHALMMSARPQIVYSKPETLNMMDKIWQARREGLNVFFTQDAGPNLKLLFLEEDIDAVSRIFPLLKVIAPFNLLDQEC
jgi:diphosphomevalonate decarboxylase